MSLQTTLCPADADYPERLHTLTSPPATITVAGALGVAPVAVAIVGTRGPSAPAARFAFDLAASLARAGAIVVSGGALGIDAAAHRGALSVGGRTWAVAATGRGECFPKEHEELFSEIARGPGAMLWPFPDATGALPGNFLRRNGVLVALSDAVVIVQAGAPSGTLNALGWANKLERPVWAVPGPPWDPLFTGCRAAIDGGARVLTSIDALLGALHLTTAQLTLALALPGAKQEAVLVPALPAPPAPPKIDDATGQALWSACSADPRHIDEIAAITGLCVATALTRLLTLALENVLVEGPEGFYRRT